MSSGMNYELLVQTQMDPDSLAYVLEQFPMVPFKTVAWVDLPPCEGCPPCNPQDGCNSTAVLVSRRFLRWDDTTDRPVYSHTTRMPVGSCCASWELRQLTKRAHEGVEVFVEVLLFNSEVS